MNNHRIISSLHAAVLIIFSITLVGQEANADAKILEEFEIVKKAVSVKPHPRQYEWQKDEFTAFIHFGVNTFTGKEWGTGFEDPQIFNPVNLNTDQWCEAIKAAGMKMVVFTAKHHDGFCLWQTRYTDHSVKSSSWLNGKGDVLKQLAASCKKYNLKLGIYLSPADLFQIENPEGLYGNGSLYSLRTIPRNVAGRPYKNKRTFRFNVDDYNEYFLNQLFELLTEYGPVHEVWFDGAHPKRKGGQKYTYNQWYELIRELAPEAVIFGKGPDVRWCGNEAGRTRESEWSVIPIDGTPENWTWPDMTDDDLGSLEKIEECLINGGFLHWYPAETNTSIRHGWFWRDEAQEVITVKEILDIWYRSVGGNTVFLLNIPPNNKGLLSERDVDVLKTVGSKIKETFSVDLIEGAAVTASAAMNNNFKPHFVIDGNLNTCWMPEPKAIPSFVEIKLPEIRTFNRIVLQEQIQDYSQRISEFNIEAKVNDNWQIIAGGTTVGYKKICRSSTISTDMIRVNIIDSRLNPAINNISLHFEKIDVTNPIITRNKNGLVSIFCSSPGPVIKYTIDGTDPDINSQIFSRPIELKSPGTVKAIAYGVESDGISEIVIEEFDIPKTKWSILDVSSEQTDNAESAEKAIDGDENTNWITRWRPDATAHPHYISIDLGEEINLMGFSYTPRTGNINGTIKEFSFYTSSDAKKWILSAEGEFGNIKNNPVKQEIRFKEKIKAQFIKLEALSEVNGNPWASAGEIGVITE